MKIQNNKVVSIEYTLYDANTKEQLDTNVGKEPLSYISGKGHIIQGLETALIGLEPSEKTDVKIDPKDAYGEIDNEAVQEVPKEQFADIDIKVGMTLYGTGEHGETTQVIVKDIKDDKVVVDFNHPLAGKTLMFSVLVTSVRDATEDELATATVGGKVGEGCGCGNGGGGCEDNQKNEHSHSNGGCCSS
ncbi:MAG: peptidylprolyl isomerase [Campylobacteraceae bacterium 4484_166]|nr:MAG: peptidylprolyl isomerase [Campylobacteraceae bacterium 4484_166]